MGLDPKNAALTRTVVAYMRGTNETSPRRALEAIVKFGRQGQGTARPQSAADMLESGIAGVTVVDDARATTWEQARELARAGKMVRPQSVTQILAAASAKRS
jgi:hypothetical protein